MIYKKEFGCRIVMMEAFKVSRSCGNCSKPVRKVGPAVLHDGGFLDQVIECKHCGWVGVDTVEVKEDAEYQLELGL